MITTETYGCDRHGEDAYQGCALCDLEALRERLHEAELVAASWKREAELNEQAANESSGYAKRLAETEALLRELRQRTQNLLHRQHGDNIIMNPDEYLRATLSFIDAFLAREQK